MELYLVRHAEPLANIGLAPSSHPDPRLSPRGIEQAEYLARRLKNIEFDKILVTNLSRAIQTAAIVGKEQKNPPPMIMDADFSERGTPVDYEADREFADTLYPNIIYEKTAIKTDYPGDLERIEVPMLKHIFRPAYQQTTHVSYEGENEIRTNPQKILLVAHACINACMFSRLVNSRITAGSTFSMAPRYFFPAISFPSMISIRGCRCSRLPTRATALLTRPPARR